MISTQRSLVVLVVLSLVLSGGCGGEGPRPHPEAGGAPDTALRSAGHERMVGILRHIADTSDDLDIFTGDLEWRTATAAITLLERHAGPPEALVAALERRGQSGLRLGRVDESIRDFEAAIRATAGLAPELRSNRALEIELELATAWLRKGEVENCIECSGCESCTYPIAAGGVHQKKEGARQALTLLVHLLRSTSRNQAPHLRALWLLNIVGMALGGFPEGLPEDWRLDPATFAGSAGFASFPDVAKEAGVDQVDLSGGVVADDLDGDGFIDLLTTTFDPRGRIHFFHGDGTGHFEERSREAGLEEFQGGGLCVSHADFDGDGDLDVFIPRGAWREDRGRRPASLLRNDGRGHFVDVTFESGLGGADFPSQVSAWADYDLDGDVDLFVGSEADDAHPYPCHLYRNDGDGHFVDVAAEAGVTNLGYTKGAAWGDYDGDHLPDLYVSNLGGENRLYRNLGDGRFRDVAAEVGVQGPKESFPCWFWDYDQDGCQDLFVATYGQDLAAYVAFGLGARRGIEVAALYRGDGRGGFTNVAEQVGLARPTMAMGAGFGDLDDDGFPDAYIGTGFPDFEALMPNLVLHNQGGRAFENVTAKSRMGHLQKGHAVAFADLDGDGDQDLFVRMGGAYRADAFRSALYRNPGFGNHSIELRLEGRRSNRFGLGAHVKATVEVGGERRRIHGWVGQVSSFGSTPYTLHLGLGQATRVLELEVDWPTRGVPQIFTDLAADRGYVLIEGEKEPRPRGR